MANLINLGECVPPAAKLKSLLMEVKLGVLVSLVLLVEHFMILLLMEERLLQLLPREYMYPLMGVELGVPVIWDLLMEIFNPFQLMVQSF